MTTAVLILLTALITWLVCRHHYTEDRPCCLPVDTYGTGSPIGDELLERRFRQQIGNMS